MNSPFIRSDKKCHPAEEFFLKEYLDYTDNDIVEAIEKGNNNGYLAIYHSRTKQLRNFVVNNGGSHEDADEIEQKTIVILYEKVTQSSFQLYGGTKLSTYLYGIAKNLWIKHKESSSKIVSSDSIAHRGSYEVDEDRFEAIDEDERKLVLAIENLGDKCQKILKAKYYRRISDNKLSIELGDTEENMIRKKRYKCMQQLKRHFNILKNVL